MLNTSAFSALTRINGFEILRRLFSQDIVIPRGVLEEYSQSFATTPPFITVRDLTPDQMNRARDLDLGQGEKEAIILAYDLGALLLMEDKKGRIFCQEMNVEIAGTYAIVRTAFEECLITREQMVEMVEKLKKDLYYRKWLIDWILEAQKPQST